MQKTAKVAVLSETLHLCGDSALLTPWTNPAVVCLYFLFILDALWLLKFMYFCVLKYGFKIMMLGFFCVLLVYQLNLWRPSLDLQSLLKEGCRYKVYNLTTSDGKKHGGSSTVQLTGTNKTQFQDIQVL